MAQPRVRTLREKAICVCVFELKCVPLVRANEELNLEDSRQLRVHRVERCRLGARPAHQVVFLVVVVRHDARDECRHRHHTRAVVPRFIFCEWEAAGRASERLAGARRSPARRIDCASIGRRSVQ